MAANHKRTLPQKELWKHFWSGLFPNISDWQQVLETEIQLQLHQPELDLAFMETQKTMLTAFDWRQI